MANAISPEAFAMVTGGYKNIGLEISKSLRSAGFRVIATYRSEEKKASLASSNIGMEVHRADMSIESDVDALFDHLESRGIKVGILVNNISSFPRGPLSSMDNETFRQAYESTVFSTFYVTNRAIPHMRKLGRGRIINMGVAGNTKTRGYVDIAAHASAKIALSVLTLSYARELSDDNITVNMVSPGIVDRSDKGEDWRREMRSISPEGRLVDVLDVADQVMEFVKNEKTTGTIVEVV